MHTSSPACSSRPAEEHRLQTSVGRPQRTTRIQTPLHRAGRESSRYATGASQLARTIHRESGRTGSGAELDCLAFINTPDLGGRLGSMPHQRVATHGPRRHCATEEKRVAGSVQVFTNGPVNNCSRLATMMLPFLILTLRSNGQHLRSIAHVREPCPTHSSALRPRSNRPRRLTCSIWPRTTSTRTPFVARSRVRARPWRRVAQTLLGSVGARTTHAAVEVRGRVRGRVRPPRDRITTRGWPQCGPAFVATCRGWTGRDNAARSGIHV
ncbi:hypothetical protein BD413DRAFT_177564 [Trametes elegans]|nr:hypothetical protein BD413DRAFT_177564 [Trametes elegans]